MMSEKNIRWYNGALYRILSKLSIKPAHRKEAPAFLNYREERFKNWIWRWDYNFNEIEKQYEIANMRAYCPNDDTELVNKSNYLQTVFVCPRCNANFSDRLIYQPIPPEDARTIKALILDNIRRGNYKRQH
jgi:hypothetical protein